MNRRGIALAADSAVTLPGSNKIYHTAEKLFSLAPSVPVGIMTNGSADMMDVPWETIVNTYARKVGGRTFDTLEEYATSFLTFIEGSNALFPRQIQAEWVKRCVGAVWADYRHNLDERMEAQPNQKQSSRKAALSEILREDHAIFEQYRSFEGVEDEHGTQIAEAHARELNELEAEIFDGISLTAQLRRDLRRTVALMYDKQWIHPAYSTGLVIAGMGEEEPFPSVLEYSVGSIAGGRLRQLKGRHCRIGMDADASVIPFAQRQTIDTIIVGIHPTLLDEIIEEVDEYFPRHKPVEQLKERIKRRAEERYDQPFMEAVSGLPRQDLAKMAEALVSLTAFVMRMTADQEETVAEPVDVALLSKGDGFVWVKHKDLIRHSGRLAS